MIVTPESTSEQPDLQVRNATREDIPQIARLFLASVDTSLSGFKFSSLPENVLSAVEARLAYASSSLPLRKLYAS